MRVARIFQTDIDNIHHAAFWLASFGIFSAVLGMIRDRLLAGAYGASRSLDIYYAAFRVPDFLYTVMLLFTASVAIIPVFLASREADEQKSKEFLGSLILLFLFMFLALAVFAFIFMPYLTGLFLPGFSAEELNKVILLSRILLLSPLLLGLSNILSAVTQSLKHFLVYGLSPIFYNIGIILGILFFARNFGLAGIVTGVVLGALFHLAVQFPVLLRKDVKPGFVFRWNFSLKEVIRSSLPRTLGLNINQAIGFVFTGIASTLAPGSIAIFNFASNLEFIPITIIGLSYSVAAFPALAMYSLRKAQDHFRAHFGAAFRHILFWAVPFSILLLVLRAQIVRVILGSGAFSWVDTRLTAASLSLLSMAVILQSLVLLLTRAFYAEGENWRPFFINFIAGIISIGAVFWLMPSLSSERFLGEFLGNILKLSDIRDIRVIALPLGILVWSLINFSFLMFVFKIAFGWFPAGDSLKAILGIFLAGICGGLTSYFALGIFSHFFDLHTFIGIFSQGFLSCIFGVAVIALILWILKNQELLEILSSIKEAKKEKEFIKHHVPAPESEKLL